MIGTWLTHLFGGSAGREGVAVQIGATLSHYFTKYFHFPKNGKVLLITGMAAGFAGLFQTPLTTLFFALEVMAVGKIEYEVLLPGFIASFTASYTSYFLGLERFSVNINDMKHIMLMILLGIIFGIVGRLFSIALSVSKTFLKDKIKNSYKRIGYISIILVIGLMIFKGRYSGLGTNLIELSFHQNVTVYDWFLKLIFTVITLAIDF